MRSDCTQVYKSLLLSLNEDGIQVIGVHVSWRTDVIEEELQKAKPTGKLSCSVEFDAKL